MLSCRCWGSGAQPTSLLSRAASSNRMTLCVATDFRRFLGSLRSIEKSLKKGVAWRSRLDRHWPETGMACNGDTIRQLIFFNVENLPTWPSHRRKAILERSYQH